MEDISNIQRILLNMKYDSKHTLTENKKLILEAYTATVNETNQTLSLNQDTYVEAGGTGGNVGKELRLISGTTFRKKGNELVTTNQTAYLGGDLFDTEGTRETLQGVTIKIACTPTEGTYNVTVSSQPGKFWWGEDFGAQLNNQIASVCSLSAPAAPATTNNTSSGSGGNGSCGAYKNSIFGEGDQLSFWNALKKQANLYMWGCKEEAGTNVQVKDTLKVNKRYKCPAGIDFFSYELENCRELAYSSVTKKDFITDTPYNGQAFTNIKDKNGQTLAAWIGANITQTSTSNQKPGAVIGAQVGSTVPKVEAKPCSGTFKQGCKDGGGDTTISKVQKCLLDKGMYKTSSGKPARVDGDFGPGTLAGIKQLLGKDTFTAEEVDTKICGPGAQTPPGVSSGGGGQDTGTQTSDDRETVGGQ